MGQVRNNTTSVRVHLQAWPIQEGEEAGVYNCFQANCTVDTSHSGCVLRAQHRYNRPDKPIAHQYRQGASFDPVYTTTKTWRTIMAYARDRTSVSVYTERDGQRRDSRSAPHYRDPI
ncbi:hypothetical protein Bbelb_412590 [Branchiostoma belcheri]|nr:hypothetical protein Bbelb_412590 [Branchiostoma belcheri]